MSVSTATTASTVPRPDLSYLVEQRLVSRVNSAASSIRSSRREEEPLETSHDLKRFISEVQQHIIGGVVANEDKDDAGGRVKEVLCSGGCRHPGVIIDRFCLLCRTGWCSACWDAHEDMETVPDAARHGAPIWFTRDKHACQICKMAKKSCIAVCFCFECELAMCGSCFETEHINPTRRWHASSPSVVISFPDASPLRRCRTFEEQRGRRRTQVENSDDDDYDYDDHSNNNKTFRSCAARVIAPPQRNGQPTTPPIQCEVKLLLTKNDSSNNSNTKCSSNNLVQCLQCVQIQCERCAMDIHRGNLAPATFAEHTPLLLLQGCDICYEATEKPARYVCTHCAVRLCETCDSQEHRSARRAHHRRIEIMAPGPSSTSLISSLISRVRNEVARFDKKYVNV